MFKFVTIITARGGSKRLPKKNILNLCGKPLIAYSIDYAKSEYSGDVYVSTDSIEIAEVSEKYGAKVIIRPEEFSNDTATSGAVLKHAAEYLLCKNVSFDYICLLQPTSPLRPAGMMSRAIQVIENSHPSSLMTVTPIVRKQGRIVNGRFEPVNYHFGQRSQDMETWFFENGLLYATSKNVCLQARVITEDVFPMSVEHIFADIDIDDLNDFKRAEYYMKNFSDR